MNFLSSLSARNILFFVLLAIVTILLAYILKPFFMAIFWAALLAGIFLPLFRRLNQAFSKPNLSAFITFAVILFIFIIPVGLVISLLINESFDIYNAFNSGASRWPEKITGLINSINNSTYVTSLHLDEKFLAEKSADIFKGTANYIFQNLSALTQNTIIFLVQFAVMLYTLFYFIRDGQSYVNSVTGYLPFDEKNLKIFISRFISTAKATLKFTIVIGGIQGMLGGLIFYITGVERALIWGMLMFVCSIVPAVGSAIIWAPAGIIMLLTGHIWQGITILVFGSVVISMVDNLLRPILLGKDIEMQPLLIFLSTLGGLTVFGFSGFVLGPLIASFFLASWDLFLEIQQSRKIDED